MVGVPVMESPMHMNVEDGLAVAVLGINFAPEPTGVAPYTTRMASGLADRGHDVHVVTAFPHYPDWRVRPGYQGWRSDDVVGGLPVTRVRHYVPKHPTTGARVLSEVSFGARLVAADWGDVDVVVCPSPALLSTSMVVLRAAFQSVGPAIGVVVQDLYSAGVGETESAEGVAADVLGRLEGWTLRRADGVAVIHDRFRRRVVESLDVPAEQVDVIRNWTHLPRVAGFDRGALRARLGWGDETVVLHAGAMGDKQGLSNVVAAGRVAERRHARVRFVLVGNGKQRGDLEREAAGCSAVEILDPLPGDDFVRALRSADVLLVNEKPGVVEMAVPSKLTSYFSTGVPVLAATEATSTTAEEIAASGAGIRVEPGDPEALVTAALRLREDSALRAEIGARGPAYCESLLSEERALDAYDAWVRKLYRRKHGDGG